MKEKSTLKLEFRSAQVQVRVKPAQGNRVQAQGLAKAPRPVQSPAVARDLALVRAQYREMAVMKEFVEAA
jgi:hypothetical protein